MKKILIIEDDSSIAMIEKDYLEANSYEVDIISNGKDGLKKALLNDSYSLIVLDVMLPSLDGFTILKKIREKSDIPVLLVSAKSLEIDKIKGLGLGADDYITKPLNFNEFIARVNAHIKRFDRLTKKNEIKILNFVGLTIEIETRNVIINGEYVNLPNKEFELLLLLAKNPNVVFSKEKIMELIWGYDSLGDTGTVAVHVKRLREKLEKSDEVPKYIETVWGAGYKFKEFFNLPNDNI